MCSDKFIANLPKEIQIGDKITVKGILSNNAQVFSVNLVNDTGSCPCNITYHFKWILPDNIIVQDYKENGKWKDPREMQYYPLDGRFANGLTMENTDDYNTNDTYSILGGKFQLEFLLLEDGIYVYNQGHNFITKFESYFDYSEIKSLQVWGDVDKIKELTFSYA